MTVGFVQEPQRHSASASPSPHHRGCGSAGTSGFDVCGSIGPRFLGKRLLQYPVVPVALMAGRTERRATPVQARRAGLGWVLYRRDGLVFAARGRGGRRCGIPWATARETEEEAGQEQQSRGCGERLERRAAD